MADNAPPLTASTRPRAMTRFGIRAWSSSDAVACVEIFARAWAAGHPYAPRAIDRAVFDTETTDEVLFVAEDETGAILGFVSLYAPQSFVHHLYVDPPFAGHGIGRALLAHALTAAGGRASLKCQLRNERALAFYRRRGWREVAAGTDEYGPWVTLRSP